MVYQHFMIGTPQDIDYQKTVILFPEAVIVTDTNSIISRVDDQTLKMFAYDNAQEIIGKNYLDLIVEPDKENVRQAIQKILVDKSISGMQCNAVRNGGTYLRISISGTLFSDENGNPKEIVLVIHDITPHLSELEQVKEAQKQLSEAQQIAHLGSWEWDIGTDTYRWSDEMYQLFAVEPSTTVTRETLLAHIHDEDKDKVKSFIQQSLAEGSAVLDFRFVDPQNQSIRWFHSRNRTFYDTDHRPVRMAGTVHDITREKELDTVKTQFLSMASHQMRGPLTTINWHAEMLLQSQSEGLSDTQKKYITELYNASKRTVRLTNDILTVSELELGRMPFKPEKLSLPKIFKRVLEDYDHKIAEQKISFKEVYSGDLPDIVTDLFLLKTIFNELVSNAISYTPPEGTITVNISVDPTHTNTFLFSIADTGYGIPKVEQEKIFSKMYRATNAKSKVMGGTGLGLYIIKLILQLNGGEIWFTSEENKGTTFFIAFPFVSKNKGTINS